MNLRIIAEKVGSLSYLHQTGRTSSPKMVRERQVYCLAVTHSSTLPDMLIIMIRLNHF